MHQDGLSRPQWTSGRPRDLGAGNARIDRGAHLGRWPTASEALYPNNTRNVYYTCMARVRTNIEIEETYLRAVMDRYGAHTKTEAVDLALRHLAGQPMTREEALAMRGAQAIDQVPEDSGPQLRT